MFPQPSLLLACLLALWPTALALEEPQTTQQLVTQQAPVKLPHPTQTSWTFYNTVSGRRQLEDPGGAPYVDEHGQRHWLSAAGEWQGDPGPGPVNIDYRFVWVELWSADQSRVYYFNQETQTSSWDRPVDLAWIQLPANVALGEDNRSDYIRIDASSAGSSIPGSSSNPTSSCSNPTSSSSFAGEGLSSAQAGSDSSGSGGGGAVVAGDTLAAAGSEAASGGAGAEATLDSNGSGSGGGAKGGSSSSGDDTGGGNGGSDSPPLESGSSENGGTAAEGEPADLPQ